MQLNAFLTLRPQDYRFITRFDLRVYPDIVQGHNILQLDLWLGKEGKSEWAIEAEQLHLTCFEVDLSPNPYFWLQPHAIWHFAIEQRVNPKTAETVFALREEEMETLFFCRDFEARLEVVEVVFKTAEEQTTGLSVEAFHPLDLEKHTHLQRFCMQLYYALALDDYTRQVDIWLSPEVTSHLMHERQFLHLSCDEVDFSPALHFFWIQPDSTWLLSLESIRDRHLARVAYAVKNEAEHQELFYCRSVDVQVEKHALPV